MIVMWVIIGIKILIIIVCVIINNSNENVFLIVNIKNVYVLMY